MKTKTGNNITELRELLLEQNKSQELINFFISKAVESEPKDDPDFLRWYKMSIETIASINSNAIYKIAKSPIERIFLASLVLAFIKADPFGLIIHQVVSNAESEISEYRKYYQKFCEFHAWWKQNKPTPDIESFLDSVLAKGKMEAGERDYLRHFTFRYHHMDMHKSFHLTMQPRFPNILIEGKSIRPDMYFWNPASEKVKVIVECDGFKYHSSKESFISDRKRDRALHGKGYQVLRFSGTEIFTEPAQVTTEICEHLWKVQELIFDQSPNQANSGDAKKQRT